MNIKCDNLNEALEKGKKIGYNKAIDDFIEKLELKYLGVHPNELYERYYPREICKQIKEIAKQLKRSENMFQMSSIDFNKCMVLFDEHSQRGIFKLSKEQIEYIKKILDSYLDLQLTLIYYDVKSVGELEEYTRSLEEKLKNIKENISIVNNYLKEV